MFEQNIQPPLLLLLFPGFVRLIQSSQVECGRRQMPTALLRHRQLSALARLGSLLSSRILDSRKLEHGFCPPLPMTKPCKYLSAILERLYLRCHGL